MDVSSLYSNNCTLDSILQSLGATRSQERQVYFKTGAECTELLCCLFFAVTPLIRALQTYNINILIAIELIKKTEKNIKCLRFSDMYLNIYEAVKHFSKENCSEFELTLPTISHKNT